MNIALTPLKSLLEGAPSKLYKHGQQLFYASDTITENFILTAGIVKVFDIDSKGDEKVLQILKAPAVLPLDSLLSVADTVSWNYSALTDVEVYVYSTEELHTRIIASPDLSAYVINWLAVESHELSVRISGMSKSDTRDKIVTVLNFFNVYYTGPERRGWKQIEFPVTHQLIADIAGITRESASIQMGILQKEKVVRSRRPYLEINPQNLSNYFS